MSMGSRSFPDGISDAVRAREFRDDDAGYLAWLATYPDGYLINILRSHNASGARVHRADCGTINGQHARGQSLTTHYVKVCAAHLAEIKRWASDAVGQAILPCGTCHPAQDPKPHTSTMQTAHARVPPVVPDGRYEIHGPPPDSAAVAAWADDYIRFEHRPPWQEQLRDEIRSRCRQLEPSAGQVLHATFFGTKHPDADVENLVLYNIDSFRVAGGNGLRFEHGAAVPQAPGGAEYRFGYRYSLAPRSGTFTDWQTGRTLASFDWTQLGSFSGEKKLEPVWLALARGQAKAATMARAPETPFAVKLQLRPPHGRRMRVNSDLVKATFDGVICAFQAHTDTKNLVRIAARIAAILEVDPAEIERLLLDKRQAILGAVPRLVHLHGAGVQWNPVDDWCVAGELLAAQPVDDLWAIKGEIVEISR